MNNNNSVSNNQAFFKDNLNLVYALGGSTPATFVPERKSELTYLRISMLKFIFNKLNFREIVCYSQGTIARALGCSRKAVNEAFIFFKEMKIIDFVSGKKKWTMNEYYLGEVLLNPYVRWALRFTFTNLTRAYFKIIERLNHSPKSAVVEPKVTQLTNVNVLEELNTSICSYRKRKDCKDICLKEHKEDRLYSEPYLTKEQWLNMQKAMWSNWSLTKKDYLRDIMTEREYEQFYRKSPISDDEIKRKVKSHSDQQAWNKRKYPKDASVNYKSLLLKQDLPKIAVPIHSNRYDSVKYEMVLSTISHTINLKDRLEMYKELLHKCPRGSELYIQTLIRKTQHKINEIV